VNKLKNSFFILLLTITWLSKGFGTVNQSLKFINNLEENQKKKAYILPLNSNRQIGFKDYKVIYPVFNDKYQEELKNL